ncbi:MAG: hypothetical protein ACK4R6_00010 [Spirosomataceae bacterium]
MKEIIDKVEDIKNITDHYLVKSYTETHNYFNEFLDAAKILKPLLTDKEFEFWCTEKMLLKQQVFAEKTFIQYAVETSVVRFFGEKFPANFKVETKINPTNEKDVDCQITDNGFTFNIEVKCSDFVSKEKIDNKDGFKFGTIGRLLDRGEEAKKVVSSALDEGLTKKGEPLKPHLSSKNMDNNLKEFLELTHEKVNPTPSENEVNVLVVGCGDDEDIQNWVNYLYASEGLFTKESFADNTLYNNVDLVVLTNQYFKHNRFFDKRVIDSWSIEKGFSLIFCNPFRRLDKGDAIKHFISICPNFSDEITKYVVPGPAPDYVKDACKVVWFVKDNLQKTQNKYLFETKE